MASRNPAVPTSANERIAAISAAKGQVAAQAAFGTPRRVLPLGKHPRLRPTASGEARR